MNIDEIDKLLAIDIANERDFLHLTPNENVVSESAKQYAASNLSNRYNFGPSHEQEKFTLYADFTSLAKNGVQELVDRTEQLVNQKIGSTNVLFAPLSGLHAMMISILTTTQVGETVFCLDPAYGGHFATTSVIKNTGRVPKFIPRNSKTLDIDYDAFAALAADETDKYVVYLDVSYSLIPFDIAALRKIVGENIIVYDASHTLGLILNGQFPNPIKLGADIITANTHKTLPASHKGMIMFANEEIFNAVSGPAHAYYSSIHLDHLITLCITINEMVRFGTEYSRKVIENANLLGDLLTEKGLTCRRADDKQWTHTHQLHLLTEKMGTVETLAKLFYNNNVAVSFDNMYGQGHFIRLGLQEVTRRGAGADEIRALADLISDIVKGNDVKAAVAELNGKLTQVHYSFDTATTV
jgi:glycine/serine hydroxymethyltransferase